MSDNNVSYPAIKAEIGQEFIINGLPMVIIPEGADLKQFPELRLAPSRIERTIIVTSALSFVDYFNRFSNLDSTIFVDIEKRKFLGILDYHIAQDDDESAGEFVKVSQPLTYKSAEFAIFINKDEWPSIRDAIDNMIKECRD